MRIGDSLEFESDGSVLLGKASVSDLAAGTAANKFVAPDALPLLLPVKYTQTSSITVSNTTQTDIISTGLFSANSLSVGKTVRLLLKGYYTRIVGNLTYRVKLNGATIITSASSNPGTVTNGYIEICVDFCIRTIGASGTMSVIGVVEPSAGSIVPLVVTSDRAINTTIANDFDVSVQWSVISNSVTFNNVQVLLL